MVGTVTVVLWLLEAPAAMVPVAWALPTLLLLVPYEVEEVVMRTCEFELAAVPVPLLRICQLTESDPPAVTLLLPRVTLIGWTSAVAATLVAIATRIRQGNTAIHWPLRPPEHTVALARRAIRSLMAPCPKSSLVGG